MEMTREEIELLFKKLIDNKTITQQKDKTEQPTNRSFIYLSMYSNTTIRQLKTAYNVELRPLDTIGSIDNLLNKNVRMKDFKIAYYKFRNPKANNQDIIKHFGISLSHMSNVRSRLRKLGFTI